MLLVIHLLPLNLPQPYRPYNHESRWNCLGSCLGGALDDGVTAAVVHSVATVVAVALGVMAVVVGARPSELSTLQTLHILLYTVSSA